MASLFWAVSISSKTRLSKHQVCKALTSHHAELLGNNTSLLGSLSDATNITVLAPSDSALRDVLNSTMLLDLPDIEGYLTAVLQYHVLNGTFYAANVTNSSTFIPTMLSNSSWENVSGAQVVEALAEEDDEGNKTVSFYGALKQQVNVTEAVRPIPPLSLGDDGLLTF